MTDTLSKICTNKREHIAKSKRAKPEAVLVEEIKNQPSPRGFKNALLDKISQNKTALIAEIKKGSPSKGIIRADFDPASLARAYQEGGAACLSVLTDIPYFQGDDSYLLQAKAAVNLPVLRKDFMLDTYQITESRALGADAILIIMAALSDTQASELELAANELGMDVLVEVHDKAELDRALAINPNNSGKIIGVNNRNLKTLEVNLATSQELATYIPKHFIGVCESGIATADDIKMMRSCGLNAFLVGESLMRQRDVTAATKALLA